MCLLRVSEDRFMQISSIRFKTLVLLHIALLGFIPASSAPLNQQVIDWVGMAPDLEEMELLEELDGWLTSTASVTPDRSLSQTIRDQPSSFDFFRSFHEEDVRYESLEDMPFGEQIRHAADSYGIDGFLVAAVVEAESSFNPNAVSHRGAVGLMQVLPTTARAEDPEILKDPRLNIQHGTRYLRQLLELYEGDLELALAAYNAGPTNVRRYGGMPPFRETQRYVEKVLNLYVEHHRGVWQGSETAEFLFAG